MADDFLDGIGLPDTGPAAAPQASPVEAQQTPAPIPAEQTPAPDSQPRSADGKFASKEPTLAPEPVPQPQQQQPDTEKEPISRSEFKGYLEERDKRQKAEARLADLERQLQQRQPKTDIPAIQNDPAAIEQHIQGARADAVFTFSERMARKEHGDEPVQAAMDWALQRAQQNPAFAAEYMRQDHPIDWAVKQQKRDRILSEIGDDPDAFIEARIAARLAAHASASPNQAQPHAAPPQPTASTPAPAAPPRSLASAPAAGGAQSVPTHAVAAVDAVFQ